MSQRFHAVPGNETPRDGSQDCLRLFTVQSLDEKLGSPEAQKLDEDSMPERAGEGSHSQFYAFREMEK